MHLKNGSPAIARGLPQGLPQGLSGEESTCNAGDAGSIPGSGRWSREWQPTLVFLPGKPHGQRSLAVAVHGVSESDTMEQLNMHAPAIALKIGCFDTEFPRVPPGS